MELVIAIAFYVALAGMATLLVVAVIGAFWERKL